MQCLILKIYMARAFLHWKYLHLVSVAHYSQGRPPPPILPQLQLPGAVGLSLEHTGKPPGKLKTS